MKNGTVQLNHHGYSQPQNDFPGVIQLHLNENLFATTQESDVLSQTGRMLDLTFKKLHRYPTSGAQLLTDALAEGLNMRPERIVISHGSSEMLRNLFFYLLKAGDTLLMPNPGWSYYKAIAQLTDIDLKSFPLVDTGYAFEYDRDLIAAHIEAEQPKAVLICSPNNPTGSLFSLRDLVWLVRRYSDVNFILDEAYYGFSDSYTAGQKAVLANLAKRSNLFVVRTFSKFYGLANLRIGFLFCNARCAQELRQLAPVFGVPSFSQEIASQRFLDERYRYLLQREYALVDMYVRERLRDISGLTPYYTGANFVLVRHDSRWWQLETALYQRGYMIKRQPIGDQKNYFRITYADIATMRTLLNEMAAIVEENRYEYIN